MKQFSRLIIFLGITITIMGLALLAYIGFYNRWWSDDWCYNRDFKNLGILGTVNTYFFTDLDAQRGYSTNRFSLTLLSGIFYLFGIFGTQILATVVIVLWLIGLIWIVFNLSKLNSNTGEKFEILPILIFGSAILLYFTLYISPHRFHVLYWQAGVHYSFTLILAVYLLGLITYQMSRESNSLLVNILIAPLAFFGGGLSETGCAYLVTFSGLMLAGFWYLRRQGVDWARKAYPATLIAFIFLVLSLVALTVSPSNVRFADKGGQLANFALVPFLAFEYAFDFMIQSLKSMPIPYAVFIIFFICLSIISALILSNKKEVKTRKTILIMFLILLVTFLLVSAVQAPSVLFMHAPPDPRGQSLSHFTLLACIAILGWLAGKIINYHLKWEWINIIALAGIILSITYVTRWIIFNHSELSGFTYRAEIWDQRDASIKTAIEQGHDQEVIEVLVIDTHEIGVQDIMRSRDMEKDAVISCGSQYYGVQAIKAIIP